MTQYKGRFDLSGISYQEDNIYVIADKKENNHIYKLNWEEENWTISLEVTFDLGVDIDIEGIALYNKDAYLINEANNEVYKVDLKNGNSSKLSIDWSKLKLPKKKWQKNAGFEGITIDEEKHILYLVKERDPRFVIEIDLKNNTIIEEYDVKKTCSKDFADLYFYEGFIYGIERNALCIAKIDPVTHKVVQHLSYKNVASRDGEKLYEPVKYGMAEALMIKDGVIWLGWDNNGEEVSDFAKEKYNLTGNLPVIMLLELPDAE
ncbi:SdiA-regulated domain-containing protein [Flammeovirga sp. EKP202]|uniref:SdiA-regulated domain-containing protein n=1 Tax=Flammeovirga sp. EKP202 TaxID=2770592 RepID=UPI00165F9903|nr:SdiA-regulated domain-containing protein [Flammeovirga sp. EKP202]MBD0400174.1 SdiA-regulated domain-containing protein [Flammeovirga sp. EKP202]